MKSVKGGKRKEKEGEVIKKSGDKTVIVKVIRKKIHPRYGKIVTRKKKFMVHNEDNRARAGDKVAFIETRPLSKKKRWKIVKIKEKKSV